MMSKWIWIAVTAAAVAYLVALFAFNPQVDNIFPKCPLYALAGLKCAGCGTQRAIHCLLHGDILQAVRYNCFLTIFAPLFVIGLHKGPFTAKPWYPYIGPSAMLLYTIVRNLPNVTF